MITKYFNSLGVMQGRLLPKFKGRYQAHPSGYWQNEFEIAKKYNLDYIEFILDYNDADQNPLLYLGGIDEIKSQITKSGVGVKSVCADYFMEAPMHSSDPYIAKKSIEILKNLIVNAAELRISDLVIPCVDQSSLKGNEAKRLFIAALKQVEELSEKSNVNLALETDLNPKDFAELLAELPAKNVTVNYDTGNSASLGYSVTEEFKTYGNRISDIHIKDRKLGGGSVELGNGDVDFNSFFRALQTIHFKGIFVMQAFRDDEGIEIFEKQLHWIQKYNLS